ncbi:MAG: mannose-1-phosphate guanylyltransferase [Acidobacteria bacterium]|nr:mannose-1-phosphate guanylyltransferase [Acidobacteriota bacterium]
MGCYVVIMAGGSGTRFWPASRADRPKQLLKLFSDKTLLEETVDRVRPVVSTERIIIVCNHRYVRQIRETITDLPPENIIAEPVGRNTAPCIALVARYLQQINPQSVMAVLPADHYIRDEDRFRKFLAAATQAAENEDLLVTLGILPQRPHTGYGYIRAGETRCSVDGIAFQTAEEFLEKPSQHVAEDFLSEGNYYWNSGMFCWKCRVIFSEIRRFLPDIAQPVDDFFSAGFALSDEEAFRDMFARLPAISIDYGVMEKSDKVVVARSDFGWNDVGSWDALEELSFPEDGNISVGGAPVMLNSRRCIVYSEGALVAGVGVEDLVIAACGDAVLVAHKNNAQDIRRLVEKLSEKNLQKYL